MSTIYQPAVEGESLVGIGKWSTAVSNGAITGGVTVIKAAPGRLCRVIVTAATTSAQAITIYDNATTSSGTVVGIIPGGSTLGSFFDFQMPCNNGITVGANASLSAGAITISWV